MNRIQWMLVGTVCVLISMQTLQANTNVPEFGRSVRFIKGSPEPQLTLLRGKVVCIIFFQSWCPKCNAWSGSLIKSMEEYHKNKPGTVLIALKTDGGGTAGALKYMKEKGADPSLWCIGEDKDGDYFKKVNGSEALWRYALVNTEGEIAKTDDAGTYYTGKGKKRWVLADDTTFQPLGTGKGFVDSTILESDKLKPAIRCIEAGDIPNAQKNISKYSRLKSEKDSVAKLNDIITNQIDRVFNNATQTMEDESASAISRYYAMCDVKTLYSDYTRYESAKTAYQAARKLSANKAVQNEKKAEAEYGKLLKRARKAKSKRSIKTLLPQFAAIAKRYPDTEYGKRAQEVADQEVK